MTLDFLLIHAFYVNEDGTPGEYLKERLDFALDWLKSEKFNSIIVAGKYYAPKDKERYEITRETEADVMEKYLQKRNVNPPIFKEREGINTWQCTVNSYNQIIKPKNLKSGGIVSSKEHLPRIIYQTIQIFPPELSNNTEFRGPLTHNPILRGELLEHEAQSMSYTLEELLKYAKTLQKISNQKI